MKSGTIKPPASLSSSTYSSAASSSSSSTSSSSSSIPCSASQSHSSSAASSPSQSQRCAPVVVVATNTTITTTTLPNQNNTLLQNNTQQTNGTTSNNNTNINSNNNNININSNNNSNNTTTTNLVPSFTGLSSASSWTTIAKRDKRRKKPAEKKIFAKEIPGNIGDRTVEELAMFIQSGTNGVAKNPINQAISMNDHKNANKTKSQQTNDRNQIQQQHKNQKSQQINTNNKPYQQHQTQSNLPNPTSQDYDQNQINNSDNNTPASISNLSTPQYSSSRTVATKRMQSSISQQDVMISQDMPQHLKPAKQQNTSNLEQNNVRTSEPLAQSSQSSSQQAVTFAHHLKVNDEAERQYTFGFFEERPDQKISKMSKMNQNSLTNNIQNNQTNNNNLRKKAPLIQMDHKQRPKQSQPSLISERTCKFKDRININSFNYEQILKFISNSWEDSQPGHRID